MSGELEGRIGHETARAFCREGARVAVADRHLAAAEDTVAALVRAGGQAVVIEMDVRDEDSVRDGIGRCFLSFGGIGNAGVAACATPRHGVIAEMVGWAASERASCCTVFVVDGGQLAG